MAIYIITRAYRRCKSCRITSKMSMLSVDRKVWKILAFFSLLSQFLKKSRMLTMLDREDTYRFFAYRLHSFL